MLTEKNTQIAEAAVRLLKKALSDLSCILAFLYTPVDLLVKGCSTLRRRLLCGTFGEEVYQSARLKQALKKLTAGSGSVEKGRLLKGSSLVSTFLLQCISFFTTWAGVSYYFSSISPYAPFALAFTIQFLFYIMSNFGSGRDRFRLSGKLLLTSVFLISMLFSYIGIMNGYVPPVKIFEQKYQTFYDAYYSSYRQLAASFQSSLIPPAQQLELLRENAGELCRRAEEETADFGEKAAALSDVRETVRTGRNEWGYVTYEINPAYETAVREKSGYLERISSLQAASGALSESLEGLSFDSGLSEDLESYLKDSSITPRLARLNNSFESFLSAYNQLNSSLASSPFQPLSGSFLSMADSYAKGRESIALTLPSFEEITASLPESGTFDNSYFYQLSDRIEKAASVNYNRLILAAQTALPGLNNQALHAAYDSLIPLPDVNLAALKKLLPSSGYFNQGIVALFLALLVDGMTVLIPCFIRDKRGFPLRLTHKKGTPQSGDEVLEQIILSVSGVLAGAPAESEPSLSEAQAAATAALPHSRPAARQNRGSAAGIRLSEAIRVISGYFSLFSSSPWTNGAGYSKYLSEGRLKSSKSFVYCHLTDILCSMEYLTVVSAREYRLLAADAKNRPEEPFTEYPLPDQEETLYLMKKNFDLWMSQNLAGLLQFEPLS